MAKWTTRTLFSGLLLWGASGCSALAPESQASAGLREADELVTEAEQLHVECELVRLRSDDAWTALVALFQRPYRGGPEAVYLRLADAVTSFEEQALALDRSADRMAADAPGFFTDWEARSQQISTATLRDVAAQRRERSRTQYEVAEQKLLPARASLAQARSTLRDLVTFLEHDFNAGSLKVVEGEARRLRPLLDRLARELHASEDALGVFVRRTAPQLAAELQLLSEEPAPDEAR